MSNNDDEFKDVVMGLPSANTSQKSGVKFVVIFTIVGILAAIVVIRFGEEIIEGLQEYEEQYGYVPAQMLLNGLVSLLIGTLQAWIFKSKIRSRLHVFIAFSLLGGIMGGLVGGLLMNNDLTNSLSIGAINGFLFGVISSLAQNRIMGNKKYGARWFLYNAIAWTFLFSIAWTIGWQQGYILNVAIAGAFLLIAGGIGLVLFLRKTPQIEFS